MALEPLNIWKSTLAALPPTAGAWAPQFSAWYAARILPISPDPSIFVAAGFLFTFNSAIFQTQLTALAPVNNALAGITGFANAWEAAILASTVLVSPGSALVPPTPATIFSVVATSLIDTSSIALGKAKLLELVSAPQVPDANDSQFPEKFREATMLLTMSVTGINSIVPPAGPLPLAAPFIPLI
jgi:hypothetical protein